MNLSDPFTGCLLGCVVGDALGAPIEFMSRVEILLYLAEGLNLAGVR